MAETPQGSFPANEKWRTKHPTPERWGIAYPGKKIQGANISVWRPHCISCWQFLAVIMETIAIRLF